LPDADPVEYIRSQIRSMPVRYSVRATVRAPAERVKEEVAQYGTVAPIADASCEVLIPTETLDWAAFCLAAAEAPVLVHGPPHATRFTPMPRRSRVPATSRAPAARVKEEVAQSGTLPPIDDASCEVLIPTEPLDWAAFCLAATEAPFVVHGPPEAIDYMRGWGERFIAATEKGHADVEG